MLYLVRKLEESIIVNNEIEIKVVEIKKNSVNFLRQQKKISLTWYLSVFSLRLNSINSQ